MSEDVGRELLRQFAADRWAAHHYLFRHRHRDLSPSAHQDLVRQIHGDAPRLNIEGFRGFGKTTLLEEAAIIGLLYGEFHNAVVVGASLPRAMDRLDAIRFEVETNPLIQALFGGNRFEIRQDTKIVLAGGGCVQALGRDQSMTGIKHREWRPDYALIDDVEDPEERRSDIDRMATWRWLIQTFLPSLDDPVTTPVRALGTRRGKGSLPERMEASGWRTLKYPIEFIGAAGAREATWPSKFGLEKVDLMREDYRGDMHTWAQEYMCEAYSEADRVFSPGMFAVGPVVRPDHVPVYAMYDPARSTGRQSSTTGRAVWSWLGSSRLVFWELSAEAWLPDQIVADLFRVNATYRPVWIGFEEDGLNEWARQPIRAEMLRRRLTLPLLPVKAPRGKDSFILGLQPLAKAGEISLSGPPDAFRAAIEQFANFGPGRRGSRIDAPNAAAYALLLRPGSPVYDLPAEAVVADLDAHPDAPLYLAASADGALVTAVLAQRHAGELRVLADFVREGSPDDVVSEIHAEAVLAAAGGGTRAEVLSEVDSDQPYKLPVPRTVSTRAAIRWVVPRRHEEIWNNVGLCQAIRAIPQPCSAAPQGAELAGRTEIARLLDRRHRGRFMLTVDSAATWVSRGFSGGYARAVDSRGISAPQPDAGIYRLLMEGLEAFVGVGLGAEEKVADQQPIAYSRTGQPYKSALPDRGARR
jgi:hypothetical protein